MLLPSPACSTTFLAGGLFPLQAGTNLLPAPHPQAMGHLDVPKCHLSVMMAHTISTACREPSLSRKQDVGIPAANIFSLSFPANSAVASTATKPSSWSGEVGLGLAARQSSRALVR